MSVPTNPENKDVVWMVAESMAFACQNISIGLLIQLIANENNFKNTGKILRNFSYFIQRLND